MTNKQIHTALIKPNAEIVVIPSDVERKNKLCLKANGIIAKKKSNNVITVLESTHSRIRIGSVILFMNGIYSDYSDYLFRLFINRNFLEENIKINEFYNNLNKKFNADEGI